MSEKIQLNTPVFYISLSNLIDSYGQSQVKYNAMNNKCDNFTLFPSAVCYIRANPAANIDTAAEFVDSAQG